VKTTIDIPDPLLDEVRRAAAADGRTVRSLVEEALRRLLDERGTREPRILRDLSYGTGGMTAEYSERGLSQAVDDSYPTPAHLGVRDARD
jgi:Arc/MetJ family transcription regulator